MEFLSFSPTPSGEAFFISSTQITFIRGGLSYVQQSAKKVSLSPVMGILRLNDSDGNKNVKKKKTVGLISKTTTLHVRHAF